MNVNPNILKGTFLLVLSAFLYSLMPVLIRTLGVGGLLPISQVFLRYIFAFISAAIYYFLITKQKVKVHKKNVIVLGLATVFGYALTNLFFTYSILLTQISNALFLFYTYAIITPILGLLVLKEKINKVNVLSLLLSMLALFLLFQPNSLQTWKLGGIFALLSAFGQALYLVLRKKLHSYSAGFMMLANTFIGVIVLGFLSFAFETDFYVKGFLENISITTWITTIIFGIDNFLAWITMTKGFEYFKSSSGSMILLTELLFGIIFALLFFGEVPTTMTLLGGALILFSTSLVILKNSS